MTTGPHDAEVSAGELAPRPAGLRSRLHNVPLTDTEAEALSGAGIDSARQPDQTVVAAEGVATEVPLTRRARRAGTAPAAPASEAAPAPEPVVADQVLGFVSVDEAPHNDAAAIAPTDDVDETPVEDVAPVADAPEPPAAEESPRAEELPVADEPQMPASESARDLFEEVVRTFGVTGETATLARETSTTADAPADAEAQPAASEHVARRRPRTGSVRKFAATSFSVGVMGIVGLLAVGMTTPVEAVAAVGGGEGPTASIVALGDVEPTASPEEDIQAYVAPAEAATATLSREEGYSAVSMAELAVEAGVREVASTYVNNASAAVQYPFAVGVPISSPYGMRWGRMHEGVDFAPGGQGAEIHAVADGIVRIATEAGGAYGVHVVIDSIVDGELVSTNYAHMQYGSLRVQAGQVIKLGDVVGTVGTTGHSTGPHLHFEVLLNGKTPTEPMAWLAAHNVPSTVVTVPEAPVTVDQ
ncbi:M23 family metallopeptidase [Microbacterium schleiferi]|uniref:M23 family metallopeptidase n=1 Tax=Microbacterium schleiferi TaxID=69362 RepID=UPI001E594DDE|nr:M23 family metallopeptidase [Microbacterium schleiferi]